jgi:arginine/ornithine transport system permease protein
MDLSIIFDNIGIYLTGLKNTILLVSISLCIGLTMAVPLAVLRTSKNILISAPIRAYVYFFRGTPLLVQMFLIYYGMGQFEAVKSSIVWPFFKEAYFCALFAFTLNTGAYTTEIIRGAIEATPHGEIEAARAMGMSMK